MYGYCYNATVPFIVLNTCKYIVLYSLSLGSLGDDVGTVTPLTDYLLDSAMRLPKSVAVGAAWKLVRSPANFRMGIF